MLTSSSTAQAPNTAFASERALELVEHPPHQLCLQDIVRAEDAQIAARYCASQGDREASEPPRETSAGRL
jgi:hypothetical protein